MQVSAPLLWVMPYVLLFIAPAAQTAAQPRSQPARQAQKAEPTHKDVRYGPFSRNVLDFWQAPSEKPAPLVVYIHGGGFRGGSKESLNARDLGGLLEAGISVAAIHYRLLDQAKLPAAHEDGRRALQFLRSKASDWNVDQNRIGAFGGSAGAQICMWLAFHDDMADPRSEDAVSRESTRLACVATTGGQTSMDFEWWKRWIPGYERPHRNPEEYFGTVQGEDLEKLIADISALSLVSKDDPPIFMSYRMAPDDPVPADAGAAQGWKMHHVIFGIKLKEKMDALGVEADLRYPGVRSVYQSIPHFFRIKLQGKPGTETDN